MKKSDTAAQLVVNARSPFHVYYDGPAEAVSGLNKVGQFDILPGHADFFSVMKPGEVAITTGEEEPVIFTITNGIVTARDNEVLLFVNI